LPNRVYDVPGAGGRDQQCWYSACPIYEPIAAAIVTDTHEQWRWHPDCPVCKLDAVSETRDKQRWLSDCPVCEPVGVVVISDSRTN
jgi:hypothetical protein